VRFCSLSDACPRSRSLKCEATLCRNATLRWREKGEARDTLMQTRAIFDVAGVPYIWRICDVNIAHVECGGKIVLPYRRVRLPIGRSAVYETLNRWSTDENPYCDGGRCIATCQIET
jgi:hypothetical protein